MKAAQERIAELEANAGSPRRADQLPGQRAEVSLGFAVCGATRDQPAVDLRVAGRGSPGSRASRRKLPAHGDDDAAGVAGGALLFEGIRGMMGHNPGPFGQTASQSGNVPDASGAVPDAQQQAMVQDDNQMAEASAAQDYDTASYDSDTGGGGDDYA